MNLNDLCDIAQELLDCVTVQITGAPITTGAPAPARIFISPTSPVDDEDACCDGQLVVYIVNMYPSDVFPAQSTTPANCGAPLTAVTFGVRITRCFPSVDDNGNPPSPEILQAAACSAFADARAIWTGVTCCARGWVNEAPGIDSVVTSQNFYEPEGGCYGSELQIIVGLNNGCDCG